jgi:hypothetical protein
MSRLDDLTSRFRRVGSVAPPKGEIEPTPTAAVQGLLAPGSPPPPGPVSGPAPEGPPRHRRRRRPVLPAAGILTDPADPAPLYPVCDRCGTRHEPRPHPAGSGGLRAAYGQVIAGWTDNGRPEPLGRSAGADVSSLLRDSTDAWRWGRRRPLQPDPREREG